MKQKKEFGKMRKITSTILAVIMAISVFSGTFAAAYDEIKITVNGNPVYCDQPPFIENGRTFVPMRAIFEAMGMVVTYQEEGGKILAIGDDVMVSAAIGGVVIWYGSGSENLQMYTTDAPPRIINGRAFVPARAMAEVSGYNVDWDGTTGTVIITGGYVSPTELSVPNSQPIEGSEFEIKGSLEFYSGYGDALDFGKLNNTPCLEEYDDDTLGHCFKYNTTGADVVNYINAVEAQGYEIYDMDELFGMVTGHYGKGQRTINIHYNKNEKIGVIGIK